MAKKDKKPTSSIPTQGKATRYPSRYSDKFIAFPQYLAEMMCERRAANLKMDLPQTFWVSSPLWKNYFFYQLKLANGLVAKYTSVCILNALNELKYIYSLKTPALLRLIEEKSKQKVTVVDVDIVPIEQSCSGVFNRRKGSLGKLDG